MLPNCSLPLRFPNYVVLPLVARHPGIGSCRAFDQPRFAGRYGPSMEYGNNSAICPTSFRRQTGQIGANTRSTLQTRASVRRRGTSRVVLDAPSIGMIGNEKGKPPCDIAKPASLNQRKRAAIEDHSSPGECAYPKLAILQNAFLQPPESYALFSGRIPPCPYIFEDSVESGRRG